MIGSTVPRIIGEIAGWSFIQERTCHLVTIERLVPPLQLVSKSKATGTVRPRIIPNGELVSEMTLSLLLQPEIEGNGFDNRLNIERKGRSLYTSLKCSISYAPTHRLRDRFTVPKKPLALLDFAS